MTVRKRETIFITLGLTLTLGLRLMLITTFMTLGLTLTLGLRYIFFTFEKIEVLHFLTEDNNKLSNDTKFINIEVSLLKIQVLQS